MAARRERALRGRVHPYAKYRKSADWKVLSRAIRNLVINQDLVEQISRSYIVGYLCKQLDENRKRQRG